MHGQILVGGVLPPIQFHNFSNTVFAQQFAVTHGYEKHSLSILFRERDECWQIKVVVVIMGNYDEVDNWQIL